METDFIDRKRLFSPEEEKRAKENLSKRIADDPFLSAELKKHPLDEKHFSMSLPALIAYLDDKEICAGCKAFYDCPKETRKGLVTRPVFLKESGSFDSVSLCCPFYQKVKKVLENFIYSDFPFEDSYYSSFEVIKALKKAPEDVIENSFADIGSESYQAVGEFEETKLNRGFYIVSDNSDGDNLLMALAFAYARRGQSVALVQCRTSFNNCSSKDPEISADALKELQKAAKAQAVFLFGLGLEYKSGESLSQVLLPFLQQRSGKGLVTYADSLLTLDKLTSSYAYKDFALKEAAKKTLGKLMKETVLNDLDYFSPLKEN
jgi:hypothetical protein